VNANEIIEQIKLLSYEEQQQVISFVRTLEQPTTMGKVAVKVGEDFKRVVNEVFDTNAELFKKLAQ
jgi:hypothetical protein